MKGNSWPENVNVNVYKKNCLIKKDDDAITIKFAFILCGKVKDDK